MRALATNALWPDQEVDQAELEAILDQVDPFDVGQALRAFYRAYAARFGKTRWGDKTPNYVTQMDVIQSALPEARFVHIIRDGRDVVLSAKDTWFGPNSVEEGARWWADQIATARSLAPKLAHYLEVRYEDLVLDTETTLRRVCDFIELDWDPAMLAYHERAPGRMAEMDRNIIIGDKVVATGSDRERIHRLTSKPPQPQRVYRWKSEMGPGELNSFEKVAGDTLNDLGYETRQIERR
jgi:hypothetical protein